MGTPHVHTEVIKAWADGKQIQYGDGGTWLDIEAYHTPGWFLDTYYRVKPETLRYRVAQMCNPVSGLYTTTSDNQKEELRFSSDRHFVRWLTDWKEVEV